MANITTVIHGSNNWDTVENQNFQNLNTEIEKKITTTGWITDGITLMNGTLIYSDASTDQVGFEIIDVDGVAKKMLIKGSVTVPKDNSAVSGSPLSIIAVPKNFSDFIGNNYSNLQTYWTGTTDRGVNVSFHIDSKNSKIEVSPYSTAAVADYGRIQINHTFEV